MLIDAGVFWLGANLVLGLFNMLPFGPLDGAKVKDWNENAFYAVISLFALLVLTWVYFWILESHRCAFLHCQPHLIFKNTAATV